MVGCISVAEDICAGAWEKFIAKSNHINEHPSAYLYAVMRNSTFDYLRSNRRVELVDGIDNLQTPEQIDDYELSQALKAVSSLPIEQRDALLLKHYSGHTLEEISNIQAIPIESAKSRIR